VYFAPERFGVEVTAQEDRFLSFADFRQRPIRRMLWPAVLKSP